jgi:hypothetical protein
MQSSDRDVTSTKTERHIGAILAALLGIAVFTIAGWADTWWSFTNLGCTEKISYTSPAKPDSFSGTDISVSLTSVSTDEDNTYLIKMYRYSPNSSYIGPYNTSKSGSGFAKWTGVGPGRYYIKVSNCTNPSATVSSNNVHLYN